MSSRSPHAIAIGSSATARLQLPDSEAVLGIALARGR